MGHGRCQHGCYPVDKTWHGGSFEIAEDEIAAKTAADSPADLKNQVGERVYDGSGAFSIDDIVDLRRYVDAFGPAAGEDLLREVAPAGEPYVRGSVGDDKEPVEEKIKKRSVSMSMIGQGADMSAYLDLMDRIDTHYKYDSFKVKEWLRASPQSQVHQELQQRRQQAEQQINRTLGNLADLYEQKQLLEHDRRKLRARLEHVEDSKEGAEGTEDELKADFVDLVDQHTGRSSILQLQANNIFPSITADFYSMTSLEDLESGHLKNLPENEKAVLRKKWKLYQKWKEQFSTAVRSKLQDVERRLNSVETSIRETENWIQPYVQDIKEISQGYEEAIDVQNAFGYLMPQGYSNLVRKIKVISWKDQSPAEHDDLYYDVLVTEPLHAALGGMENPQAPGQGLVIMKFTFWEYLCCKHVYETIFQGQVEEKQNEVHDYVKQYVGEQGVYSTPEELETKRDEIRNAFDTSGVEEELEEADMMEELERIEASLEWEQHKDGVVDRLRKSVKAFFGATDEFYHPHPAELRREMIGPGFPTQLYLDIKYENGLYVMK